MDFNHLDKVEENYFVHLGFTVRLFIGFLCLAVVSLIHGLLPFLFPRFVSQKIQHLNSILESR